MATLCIISFALLHLIQCLKPYLHGLISLAGLLLSEAMGALSHAIRHKVSAPYNPKSNGLAEAGVKSVKNILRKCAMSNSNADSSDGYSPAQLMFGHAQRTSFPSLPSQNVPIDFLSAASSKDAAQSRAKVYHDRSKLSLPPFSPGQEVHLQDSKSSAWDRQGVVVSMRPDRLSYVIRVGNRFFTRPRRLL